jgi:pilus assembly protein CpaF
VGDLLQLVLERDGLADLDPAARRLALRSLVAESVDEAELPQRVCELAEAIDGFGPLSRIMRDESVTDVLVNGPNEVWAERDGRLIRTDVSFSDSEQLHGLIERLMGLAGVRADVSRPVADGRLSDGSRIHVVLPPIAPRGPLVSIRRFPQKALSLSDLVDRDTLSSDWAALLAGGVSSRTNIAISGGTGSGKTTLLNALLGEITPAERVVLIEETPELCPPCGHCVGLVTRDDNVEGLGRVESAELVRAALRMRPDRIVVGEIRGPEALAALAALSVGHEGSMVTVHSRSAEATVDRIVSLALSANSGATEAHLRAQVTDAFGLFVHLQRDASGARRVGRIVDARAG